jgi:hypothetical protein
MFASTTQRLPSWRGCSHLVFTLNLGRPLTSSRQIASSVTREYRPVLSKNIAVGLVLQLIAIGVVLRAINARLKLSPATSNAVVA